MSLLFRPGERQPVATLWALGGHWAKERGRDRKGGQKAVPAGDRRGDQGLQEEEQDKTGDEEDN